VPTSINLFKMSPLRGHAMMIVDTRLVFAFVENLFGGAGSQPKVEGRDFTPIEQKIIKKVVLNALTELEQAWQPVHDISIEFQRSEINPQFASIIPPSDVVVVVTFEVELENAVGNILVALPYATIEPIRSKLYASYQSERLEVDQTWVDRLKDRLMDTPLDVRVRLGQSQISSRQLLNLSEGDIIMLDTDVEDSLTAEIEGIPKFRGQPGQVKGNRAFVITEEQQSEGQS
jgi:flagellar motor switch protein FliM